MVHLLRCFEVYGQAICHFAHPGMALRLQEALCDYRIRLAELSMVYRFDTVREYSYAFMSDRILNGQDDPPAWTAGDDRCYDLLIRKQSRVSGKGYQSAGDQKSASPATFHHDAYEGGFATEDLPERLEWPSPAPTRCQSTDMAYSD